MASRELKDHFREQRIFFQRAIWAALGVIALSLALFARYYYLQINQHEVYKTLSDRNRMQLQSITPTRGLIYDRNGVLLADNQPTFSLTLVKERTKDVDATIAELQDILEITDDDVESFRKRMGQRRRPYESVTLKSRLTEEEIARIAVNRHRLAGVEVEAELIRYYPLSDTLAHVLGYVGRISERELKQVDPANYSGTQYYGKLGVERHYESLLHGSVGYQTVETDARGRVLRVLDRVAPTPGADISLYLDVNLQRAAIEALDGRRGAVVAIEPSTGGILALVSTPSFDPNLFVTGIDSATYKALQDSPDIPLFNRALRGQYPPGSTIKPFLGLAGLDTETINVNSRVWDPGWYQLKNDDRKYRDWKRSGHGWVDLNASIEQSCDVFFYDMAFKMGVDNMYAYMAQFGFGEQMVYDIDEAQDGILPSREWKRAARRLPWFPGDSLNMGIGQGFMLSTPMQLATATAVLANRGKWVRPRLIKTINESEVADIESPPDVTLKQEWYWNYVIKAMEGVMHGRHGTARSSGKDSTYKMAGKTGTAQVIGIKQNAVYDAEAIAERHRDHALFVGFAPVDNPKIAVAVLVENGGGGSGAAAPVARKMFDAHLVGPKLEPGQMQAASP
ncbi:penicillin-binding protein 2 [Hahella sp. KA22]|uniref:penicillin-binding protein 2 n=1 Tax=Hahella sp. KA22 TaxID=1628392 RepID=UPI000FDEAB4B|nr:penicillin-binding protein 2 [Hahella sp. KA22]AZZ90533.1 penicillin-binding protein 2 [Hahella sp. KA22]QAY53903.1 penicillin-binding protein 2 [Hahella sp. KA22]